MLRAKIRDFIKFVLFLSFGVGIFWYVYRKQDPDKMWAAFEGVNFFWLGLTVLVMLISHVSRSVRWIMLIEPLGKKVFGTQHYQHFWAILQIWHYHV